MWPSPAFSVQCPSRSSLLGHFNVSFLDLNFSESEPKGAECLDKFSQMQECMKQFPDLYESSDPPSMPEEPVDPPAQETPTSSTTDESTAGSEPEPAPSPPTASPMS